MNEEEMIAQYDRLARKIARQYAQSYKGKHEYDDLVQAARMGVLEAIRSYNPERGVKLMTHCHNRAKFAIHRLIRSNTGLIHIPYKTEHDENADKPIRVELPEQWENHLVSGDSISQSEGKIVLAQMLELLTPRQRAVITMAYLDNMTMEEIAEELGVTRQAVHNCANKALTKLRAAMEKANIDLGDMLGE